MIEHYDWLKNIGSLQFTNKKVLIIGGGMIAKQYALAFLKFNITNITIIAKTGSGISNFCTEKNIVLLSGGFEKHLPNFEKMNLVIIATPIPILIKATKLCIENGQDNILIEKPGSLYSDELLSLSNDYPNQRIRIAYNRLVYPNLHKLKQLINSEGGVTSCRFTFTEWFDRIEFEKDESIVYQRWGISNSLHVISMAFDLIGLPKEITTTQSGKIDWHVSGSKFTGCGISENDIPFTYHADWGSGGRWGIEIFTKENTYLLISLEELYVCPKFTGQITPVEFEIAFPDVKLGIPEEIAIMLDNPSHIDLVSLEYACKLNKITEKIMGYSSNSIKD
jgi:predicted dehydrogenase